MALSRAHTYPPKAADVTKLLLLSKPPGNAVSYRAEYGGAPLTVTVTLP